MSKHSETQRLLRERRISLPYHRPKQRTLQEFLNRQKLSAAFPKAPSIAAKLKMSSTIVSQILAEKEKEVELFYKSSDSEDETQQTIVSINKTVGESSSINKKLPSMDIDRKELSCLTENDNQDNGLDIIAQSIVKEYSGNLQETAVIRKLFNTDSKEETSKTSNINHNQDKVKGDTVDTIVTSSNKEKYINDTNESKVTMSEKRRLQVLNTHQCDSEVTCTSEDQSLIVKAIAMLEATSTINKQVVETSQMDNNMMSDVVTSTHFNDHTVEKDYDEKNNYTTVNDLSSLSSTLISSAKLQVENNLLEEKNETSNGLVLGLPLPKSTNEVRNNKKRLLSKLMPNSEEKEMVTLKGSPGMIIDLTDDAKPCVKGVNILLDRFFCKHVVNTNKQDDNKSEVTVVHMKDTENGPVPIKEILTYKSLVNTDNPDLNKPGAKLMRLKEDLRLQMTLKRNEEWKQKEIELQSQEKEEWNEEKEFDCDSEEQKNVSNESSDSGESEPEENDICIKNKRRRKCLFADDEAEVTDDENSDWTCNENDTDDENSDWTCNENDTDEVECSKQRDKKKQIDNNASDKVEEEEEGKEEEEEKEKEREKEEKNENENDNLNMNVEDENEINLKDKDDDDVCKNISVVGNEKKKILKQLIVNYGDDSKDENSQSEKIADAVAIRSHHEDNDWTSGGENNASALQQHPETAPRNQICKTPVLKTSMLDFISPVTQLSVLNIILDSDKNDTAARREYLVDNHEITFMKDTQIDKSPECTSRNKIPLQKKLFDDIVVCNDDEYLMQLCSGKFASRNNLDLKGSSVECSSSGINVESIDIKRAESSKVENEISQNIRLSLDEVTLDDSSNYMKGENEVSTANSSLKSRFVSSDDDNQSDEQNTFLKPKKRPVKRLSLSDSEEEDVRSSDEKSDDVSDEEETEQYVDYDSEENEVIVVPKKDLKKVAANFLEEEAELSESDWDSADEDEKDMDKLDFEKADEEHINEDEVKDQLEKIHMKQMLDEDKREVRILKEILFEDGDLHTDGAGRERKFRWRNIDKLEKEMPQAFNENDGWIDIQEDEEEAKWVKLRQERDKFLEERMKSTSNEIEDDLRNSKIFKFGLEALKKVKSDESETQYASFSDKVESFDSVEPIVPRNIMDLLNVPSTEKKSQTIYNVIKRRSLLTRGEEALARIASLAKQNEPISHKVKARNCVLHYVDPHMNNLSKIDATDEERKEKSWNSQIKNRKRKVTLDVLSATKKKRKEIIS